MGELEVRGPWVAASYLGDEGRDRWTKDGWFKTGDVVTIEVRTKDSMAGFYIMSGSMKRGETKVLTVDFSVAWKTPGDAP